MKMKIWDSTKRNKSSSGNNRGTKIKVWWREKKKRHSQLEWLPNINPFPHLSRTIYWQPPPRFTRGTSLCPLVHFWHRRPPTHAGPEHIMMAWQRDLVPSIVSHGKLPFVQRQVCRTSKRPVRVKSWVQGINFRSTWESKETVCIPFGSQ